MSDLKGSIDLKGSLLNQIHMLEKAQKDAFDKGDLQKVQEIAHTILSISNMINNQK